MSDEQPKETRKKGKRMVNTNVRVTKETHERLKTLSELLGLTMSEAIDHVINSHYPEVETERRMKQERKSKLLSRNTGSFNN
ncbi:MAG: hypothetical protein JNJ61_17295 [Anaerolineae bacterium]|nr:hypothetical protein [Anaerolineae bacterium]